MALLVRMLKQQAVYWAPASVDHFGKLQYAAPITVKVRWEDTNNEVLTADGEKTISAARVFANLNDLQLRGVLLLLPKGQGLSYIQDQNNPFNNTDSFGTPLARRIIKFDKMPDLKNRNYLRIAYLN